MNKVWNHTLCSQEVISTQPYGTWRCMFWYKATKFIEDHAVQYQSWMSSILIILLPTYHTRRHTRDDFNLHIQHWKPQIAYTIFYNLHTSCYTWERALTRIRSRERVETKYGFAHCWQELYAKVLLRADTDISARITVQSYECVIFEPTGGISFKFRIQILH